MVSGVGVAAGEDGLAGRELPDADRGHLVGVLLREAGVNLFIVLAVVAEQQPAHVRELLGQQLKVPPFVFLAAAEPAVVRQSPVREQQRAGGIEVPGNKTGQGGSCVPRPRGQVDHRRLRVLHLEPIQQDGHAGCRHPCPFVQDEGVPQRQEGPGEGGDHDGVVNVRDDAQPGVRGDHENPGLDRFRSLGAQHGRMPARGERHLDHGVHQAAAVRMHAGGDPADLDLHLGELDRDAREGAPAADVLVAVLRQPLRLAAGVRLAGEDHPAQYPDPLGGAVALVGDGLRD